MKNRTIEIDNRRTKAKKVFNLNNDTKYKKRNRTLEKNNKNENAKNIVSERKSQ